MIVRENVRKNTNLKQFWFFKDGGQSKTWFKGGETRLIYFVYKGIGYLYCSCLLVNTILPGKQILKVR